MAIAYDTSTGSSGTGNTLSFSHTFGGDNRFAAVAAIHQLANSGISGITIGGVAATYLTRTKYTAGNYWVYLYYLPSPASGAQTIAVTASGANSSPIAAACISLSGVNQESPINVSGITEQANSTSISKTLTTTTDGCWGISALLAFNNTCTNLNVTNSLTQKRQCYDDMLAIGDSNGTVANGSVTFGWSSSATQLNAMLAFAVNPHVGATTSQSAFFLNFV